jgi:4-amino-4-deoxy-L-arabinose transferase-like glycosyltransferase
MTPSAPLGACDFREAPAPPALLPEGWRGFSWLRRSPRATILLALAGCVLFSAILGFTELGTRPLTSPGEARYALIAREMLESGDWVQPRLNHVRYYEKPPLLYWSVAASYRIFGVNDFAARLPSALAYVGTTAVTFLLGLELLGPAAAPRAALIYASSMGPFIFARFLFTDTLFVFYLTLSLLGLARIVRRGQGFASHLFFYGGLSLAGLTKGLVGVLFPLATAGTWWLFFADRRFLRDLRPLPGFLIVALILVPWHVLLQIRDPSFLSFYIVNEHVLRFLNVRDPTDYTPLSVPAFWLSTLVWLSPWSLFLVGVAGDVEVRRRALLPLIWSAWVLGFFTLNASRLESYALPAFPALALVLGAHWQRACEAGRVRWTLVLPGSALLGVALFLLVPVFVWKQHDSAFLTSLVSVLDGYYRQYFSEHPGASFPLVEAAVQLARPVVILLAALGAGVTLALRVKRLRLAFVLWVAGAVPFLAFVDGGMRLVAADRSQSALARIVTANWSPGAELIVAGDYEDYCGITYYTGLPTKMLGAAAADLQFGYRKGDARDLFLTPEDFEREWASVKRVFVVGDRSLKIPGAAVLLDGPRQVLLSNHSMLGK